MEPFIDDASLFKLLRNPDYSKRACEYINSVFEYVQCVLGYRMKVESTRALGDPDHSGAIQSDIEAIDVARTMKHNRAISSLAILNRMAERTGYSPVYCGDIHNDSRKDVAHAIFNFSKTILETEC